MQVLEEVNPSEVLICGMVHNVIVINEGKQIENISFVDIEERYTLKTLINNLNLTCALIIVESPLIGIIYRYNNYGKQEVRKVGTMEGYA